MTILFAVEDKINEFLLLASDNLYLDPVSMHLAIGFYHLLVGLYVCDSVKFVLVVAVQAVMSLSLEVHHAIERELKQIGHLGIVIE